VTQWGSRASDRECKNQIEEGGVVEHIEADQIPLTPVSGHVEGGQEKAAERRGVARARVCVRGREK
jgi:hypothetical protein